MGRHTSTDLNEEDFALGEADRLARQLAEAFNKDYERVDLAPEVSVHRTIGGDDQPLYVFQLNVDLADDLPSEEYPMGELQVLASALRAKVAGTDMDRWRWLVSLGTKAGAGRQ